ncbi:MAG: OsmC family protein [Acidobacteria bacterium]|nr:OsmC family protein [Acidobacteriota bacterium]
MTEQMEGYKERVDADMKARLVWDGELIFTASTQRGYDMEFDANVQMGCMPLEGLLLSLAGCLAIDVVSILQKMRCELSSMSMKVHGKRSETPPQRLHSAVMEIFLKGNNLTDEKVQRAISLSTEKYCSVHNSLREDIDIRTIYHLE